MFLHSIHFTTVKNIYILFEKKITLKIKPLTINDSDSNYDKISDVSIESFRVVFDEIPFKSLQNDIQLDTFLRGSHKTTGTYTNLEWLCSF